MFTPSPGDWFQRQSDPLFVLDVTTVWEVGLPSPFVALASFSGARFVARVILGNLRHVTTTLRISLGACAWGRLRKGGG